MKNLTHIIYILISILTASCTDTNKTNNKTSLQMNTIDLRNLENKVIFFGHQSVGVNIINGVERFAKNNKLDFQLSRDSISPQKNKLTILHTAIGKNGDPFSKIEDYKSIIIKRKGEGINFAIFKFCYTDINSTTHLENVFNAYVSMIDSLQEMFPEITFIHSTIPLRALQKGPKALIKRILGKSIGCKDNVARNEYSNLVREKYGSNYVFDIAELESTRSDGVREEKKVKKKICYALVKEYTYDGGHLTNLGEDYLGREFILFLSNINSK